MKTIAVLNNGSWCETPNGLQDVAFLGLTQRQFHALVHGDYPLSKIKELYDYDGADRIDEILGLLPPKPLVSDEALWFAIGEVLSDWNPEANVNDVLSYIGRMTDDVVVCEAFEDWDGEALYAFVISLAESAQRALFKM